MLAWLQLPFCRCANRTIETVCIHIAVTSGASISTKRDTEVRCRGWPFCTFLYLKPSSESIFSGSEIWPKFRAGFGKTQNFLMEYGMWPLPEWKRDSPAIFSEFWHEIRYWERKGFSGKRLQKFGMRDCRKRDRGYGTRKVLINVPQRPQVLRHFPFQGNWSQFPAFSASLQRISSCKSWQTKKHNKTIIFYSKCSQVHLTFESE